MQRTKNNSFIEKGIFLDSSIIVIHAFADLASRRLIDELVREDIRRMQSLPAEVKKLLTRHGAGRLANVKPEALKILTSHLDESYITLSYSWLEAYLSIVEEALYLNDPQSLGDNIQIKLGKILETSSIPELVHDAVKKRMKEKSSWGLKNRILDLKQTYGVDVGYTESSLETISRTRNDLVHDKRIGDFSMSKDKVTYRPRKTASRTADTNNYLHNVVNLIVELFLQAAKTLKIDGRTTRFKSLRTTCNAIRNGFEARQG